ncbi:GT99 family glycosyltransferase N-terminal domain-containing protein [Luteibacter aegosomatissinici]|uniref:GT99 family glycosyltransferase N-terminal domain-containing protein n=1 Tax=Luteibacter aegosomatissinici TaxID=2911539 RepID=UPI001FF7488C|nr:hypothetical protein [Luteibacter aegosomatissinici]UPG95352.1 hypothetical protein L2Y97_04340 [Luteibacter aegosomatissinici]
MIAAFLPPYSFRGLPAPYLWVFYRLLHSIGEPMAFLLSSDYLATSASLEAQGRPELDLSRQRALGYVTPDASSLERHQYRLMDSGLMHALLPRYQGNPLAFFRAFLEDEIPELRAELESHLRSLPEVPEVILSWSNCPSLAAAAHACGTRVAYLELGPLRGPLYRSTAYFDFRGVNGHTEAHSRYEAMEAGCLPENLALETLRRSFSQDDVPADPDRHHGSVGVVLQVEDDSNLLSYSNGFDNTALLTRAIVGSGRGDILVRTHPGSRFALADPTVLVDNSPNSAAFVQRCGRVMTINSSVGLEALLYGVPVEVLGDSSYAFIAAATDERERLRRMAFYLFGYLVPFDEVFTADYIRFRISGPSEQDILARHVTGYAGKVLNELGSEAIRTFVTSTDSVGVLLDRYRHTGAEPVGVSKLYFRSEGEHFSEERVVACMPVRDGDSRVARFRLPVGVRPVALRFDPASTEGTYVFTASGWGSISANESLTSHYPLNPLYDMGIRVLACGDRLFSEPGRVPVKVLASGNDPFVELSVDDLFAGAVGEEQSAVFEVRFHLSDGKHESVFGFADLRDRLAHIEQHLTAVDLSGMRQSVDGIQAELQQMGASVAADDVSLREMKSEIAEILERLRRRFWQR